MTDDSQDVPAQLRKFDVGTVFTHGSESQIPDSWIKIGPDSYRRTYDWLRFRLADFSNWSHVELTQPIDGSICQNEADAREANSRDRSGPTETGSR